MYIQRDEHPQRVILQFKQMQSHTLKYQYLAINCHDDLLFIITGMLLRRSDAPCALWGFAKCSLRSEWEQCKQFFKRNPTILVCIDYYAECEQLNNIQHTKKYPDVVLLPTNHYTYTIVPLKATGHYSKKQPQQAHSWILVLPIISFITSVTLEFIPFHKKPSGNNWNWLLKDFVTIYLKLIT